MVTGGNGFIGSWIIRALAITYSDCYNLVSFDKLDYGASLNNTRMLNSQPNFTFYEGDIMSPDDITRCLQLHSIDTIIHLAAQSNVDASLKSPASFAATNIVGTQVMLECAKACNVRKFVQMSSYEVYGATKCGSEGHDEDEALVPMNPYGAGKAAAEMLVTAFGHCNALETLIVRTNNIYGPNQYPDKIIPKFIMLLQHREKLTMHGGGTQRKRYLYAGDAANAFNVLLHRGVAGKIYNLGSSTQISNRDLGATLLNYVNLGGSDSSSDSSSLDSWIETVPGRPYADSNSGLDCRKLKALGWEPRVPWEEGLRRTVEWYARFGDTWWKDAARKS
ncbi:dTDP-4-amino-4,6-dideoxygalactose transaminase [Physcia stellaris]|nr:dTDP-4-amino-4,6-dideoxygalactose transaminase [Physcia stellaris]